MRKRKGIFRYKLCNGKNDAFLRTVAEYYKLPWKDGFPVIKSNSHSFDEIKELAIKGWFNLRQI